MLVTHLRRLVSQREEKQAEAALGRDHVLVRALGLRRALAWQLAVTTLAALFGIVGSLRHVPRAPLELGAAVLVVLVLAAAFLFVRGRLRSVAQELIASGHGGLGIHAVDDERRRLLSRKAREHAARWLEDTLRHADRWSKQSRAYRPRSELRLLQHTATEIRDVAATLRSSSVNVVGVARTMRLVNGGVDSLLFTGDVERLRHELNGIRVLLEAESRPAHDNRLAA